MQSAPRPLASSCCSTWREADNGRYSRAHTDHRRASRDRRRNARAPRTPARAHGRLDGCSGRALTSVTDYHAARHAELEAYFAEPAETRDAATIQLDNLQPPLLERTAWDLALANESLAHIDADLAFALSRTYYFQNIADELGRSVMNAMYARPPTDEDTNFFAAVHLYYGDLIGLEPGLIATYDQLIPAIDGELAE